MTKIMRLAIVALMGLFVTLTAPATAVAQSKNPYAKGKKTPPKKTPPKKTPPKTPRRFTGGGRPAKTPPPGDTPKCYPFGEIKDPKSGVMRCATLKEALHKRDQANVEKGKAEAKTMETVYLVVGTILLMLFMLLYSILHHRWVRSKLDGFAGVMLAVGINPNRALPGSPPATGGGSTPPPPPDSGSGSPPTSA